MCSDHERDREKENWIDKGKQGRKHDDKWGGRRKTEKKKFLTRNYQNNSYVGIRHTL